MIFNTALTRLLGVDAPIISAPLSAATPEMVAAVSNAGGLGLYSVTWRSLEEIRRAIRKIKRLTPKPFGVNMVLEWPMMTRLEVCLEEGVQVISFWWGVADEYVLRAHAAGAKVMFTVGSVDEAVRAVNAGVDVIVAQGWEAGGHVRGKIASLPLIPQVVDAVGSVPVVAAGGIADGRGIAAAFALGAAGVWLGTRFLVASESKVHPTYQREVIQAHGADTVYTKLFDGGWDGEHRVLRNSTVNNWEAAGQPAAPSRPGEGETVTTDSAGTRYIRYDMSSPSHGMNGNPEQMALYAGQAVGLVNQLQSISQIFDQLKQETALTLRQLTTNLIITNSIQENQEST